MAPHLFLRLSAVPDIKRDDEKQVAARTARAAKVHTLRCASSASQRLCRRAEDRQTRRRGRGSHFPAGGESRAAGAVRSRPLRPAGFWMARLNTERAEHSPSSAALEYALYSRVLVPPALCGGHLKQQMSGTQSLVGKRQPSRRSQRRVGSELSGQISKHWFASDGHNAVRVLGGLFPASLPRTHSR